MIKMFVGTFPNAVRIQIWTALIAILIVKYLQIPVAPSGVMVYGDSWHKKQETNNTNRAFPEGKALFVKLGKVQDQAPCIPAPFVS